MLQEYLLATNAANIKIDTSISSSEISKLLFFFERIYVTIASKHEHDILPMHEQSKEKRRRHRNQKDIGKMRKAEFKARKIERNDMAAARSVWKMLLTKVFLLTLSLCRRCVHVSIARKRHMEQKPVRTHANTARK